MKNKHKKLHQKVFICIFFLIISFGFLTIFKTPKENSIYENRPLSKFQALNFQSYLRGSFQDNFENSFKDQFWFGGRIKVYNNIINSYITDQALGKSLCKNEYIKITDSYYSFNCDDYLINNNYSYSRFDNTIKQKIEQYNKLSKYADLYYYFINRSSYFDFKNNKSSFSIDDYLNKNYSQLKFNNYDEYKNYFYKTDHHWNYKGSYKGYSDIIKMITSDEPIKYKKEVTFDIYFYGSSARTTTFTKFKELFTVYTYDLSNHNVYVNGELSNYGNADNYFNSNYSADVWTNRYAEYYGNDYAEVIFDYANSNRENLLILSNSFSNSVNELIASHFNKTYVIDLRYYEETFGHKFDYAKYIKQNNINKILVICDINYLISSDFNLEEEV